MPPPDNICSADDVTVNADKADAIRFIGGFYSGKTGWLRHSRRKRGNCHHYVLVDLGDNTLKKTYVEITSIAPPHAAPTSFVGALLQQHSAVEKTMNDLCKKLARFEIQNPERKAELIQQFATKLDQAIDRQNAMGVNRATWKQVNFTEYPPPRKRNRGRPSQDR
jgi:hypothetical protein